MMRHGRPKTADWDWGLFLVCIGVAFLIGSGSIPIPPRASGGDPGARFVPQLASLILIVAGIGGVIAAYVRAPADDDEAGEADERVGGRRTAAFAALTMVYLICVPHAFFLSTICFVWSATVALGGRCVGAFFSALAIALVVWVLFAKFFLVPLPTALELLHR